MTPQIITIATMELQTGVLSTLVECYLGGNIFTYHYDVIFLTITYLEAFGIRA